MDSLLLPPISTILHPTMLFTSSFEAARWQLHTKKHEQVQFSASMLTDMHTHANLHHSD